MPAHERRERDFIAVLDKPAQQFAVGRRIVGVSTRQVTQVL
jgi:hypothetical protein